VEQEVLLLEALVEEEAFQEVVLGDRQEVQEAFREEAPSAQQAAAAGHS
jgi:hypothetical protein